MTIRRDLATLPIGKIAPTTTIQITRMTSHWCGGPGLLTIAWNCQWCGRRHATLDIIGEVNPPARTFITLDGKSKAA